MINEKKVLGMVFADMHDHMMKELTELRTTGSVPFGGRYRLIDFILSNIVNSDIYEVGLITKSNYQSLMDHLGSGREWDLARKSEGLHILPPYGMGHGIYRGRIEALGGALDFIRHSKARYVLLADCAYIYNADYRPLIQAHIERRADITVLYKRQTCTVEDSVHATMYELEPDGRVKSVLVNPLAAGEFNMGLDVMVMDKKFLEEVVTEALGKGLYNFEKDILQARSDALRIYGCAYTGMVKKISSMKQYYDANMDLLREEDRAKLFLEDRPIYTKIRDEVPVKYGLDAVVHNALIADGCVIEGEVENSILFRGVRVERGAKVSNSIIMQGTIIGQKSEVSYAVTDKDVRVNDYRILHGSELYPVYIAKGSQV